MLGYAGMMIPEVHAEETWTWYAQTKCDVLIVWGYTIYICYPQTNLPFSLFFSYPSNTTWSTLLAEDMLSYLFVRDAERNIGNMGRTKSPKHLIWRKMLLQENAAYRLHLPWSQDIPLNKKQYSCKKTIHPLKKLSFRLIFFVWHFFLERFNLFKIIALKTRYSLK